MLEQAGDAQAQPLAALLRLALALGETGEIRERQRLVEHGGKIAAVIGRADRCLERDLLRRNEVAPADLVAVDAGEARRLVDETLEDVVRLRPPGAAERAGRGRVGEGAAHLDVAGVR